MKTVRLTAAQAAIKFLVKQYSDRDNRQQRFFAGCFGIFGHGNVAGIGQALQQNPELLGWAGYKGEFEQKVERSIHDGLAWLNHHFTVKNNPPGGQGWHYYYLFGLERAGVLTNKKFIGDHDWYREGADYLVDRQKDDGSWSRGRGPRAEERMYSDTCFALLFLNRVTKEPAVPIRPPVVSGR